MIQTAMIPIFRIFTAYVFLRKDLNLLDVFSITIGAVMSTGIFLLPGLADALAGKLDNG
jgi:hypothetical protein